MSQDITVTVTQQARPAVVVTVVPPPPQVIPGTVIPLPPSPTSPATAVTFSQAAPAAVWLIDHGLPHQPSVTVIDSAGSEVYGQVEYPSPTQVRVSFSAPFSGTAVLI